MADKKRRIEIANDVVRQATGHRFALRAGVPESVLRAVFRLLEVADIRRLRSANKAMMLFKPWTIDTLRQSELVDFDMPLLKALDLFATQTTRLVCGTYVDEGWLDRHSDAFIPWPTIMDHLPRLRHLSIQGINLDSNMKGLHAIVKSPTLVRLDIPKGFGIDHIVDVVQLTPVLRMARLHRLYLGGPVRSFDRHLLVEQMLEALPSTLTDLRMDQPLSLTRSGLKLLLQQCPELTRLHLHLTTDTAEDEISVDDWRLLYEPPRPWHEIHLQRTAVWIGGRKVAFGLDDEDVLLHFARAQVQESLVLAPGLDRPWTGALWRRFIQASGKPTSPLRVLRWGRQPLSAADNWRDVDLGAALLEGFPRLEETSDCHAIAIDAKAMVRAYKQEWPLISRRGLFPNAFPYFYISGDVAPVMDFLIAGRADRFHTLDETPLDLNARRMTPYIAPLLQSQRTWADIKIQSDSLDLDAKVGTTLSQLPTIRNVDIDVRSVDFPLPDWLLKSAVTSLRLTTTDVKNRRNVPSLPVQASWFESLWNNPERSDVALEHAILEGLSSSEWARVIRGWRTTRKVEFTCLLHKRDVPTFSKPTRFHWGYEWTEQDRQRFWTLYTMSSSQHEWVEVSVRSRPVIES
jgi:hypothetical protein